MKGDHDSVTCAYHVVANASTSVTSSRLVKMYTAYDGKYGWDTTGANYIKYINQSIIISALAFVSLS